MRIGLIPILTVFLMFGIYTMDRAETVALFDTGMAIVITMWLILSINWLELKNKFT